MKPRILSTARLSFPLATAIAALLGSSQANAQTSFTGNATTAWNALRWNNSADAAPYTAAFTANNAVNFTTGTYSFATGIGSGTINIGNVTLSDNVTVNFTGTTAGTYATGGAVRTINVGTNSTYNMAAQGVSTAAGTGFIKSGAGTWATAGGAYTGGFTLNAGTMALAGVNGMGANGTLAINGGTIRSSGTAARDLTNRYTGITIGGNFTLGDATNNGNLTFNNTVALGSANRTITANSTAVFGVNSVFSGSAGIGFTKNGTGILRLNAVNTLTGVVEVSEGLLQIGSYTGLSTANSITVSGGGTSNLQLVQVGTGTTTNTINKALSLHGTLSTGGGNSTNRLNQTWQGNITLAGNSTINNNGSSQFIIDAAVDLGAHTLTLKTDGAGSRITAASSIIGSGSLIKSSPQDLTLFGVNNYAGTTTIEGGQLRFVTPGTLYNSDTSKWTAANINVQSGATLAFNVSAPTQFSDAQITTLLTNLAASGNTTEGMNAGSNFAFNTDTVPNTFTLNGLIADSTGASGGARGLIKQGIGNLTLTNANTYTGNTSVNGGTLRLENTSASASITLVSGATLAVGADTAFSAGPRIVSTAATIVSDRATAGAGLTHAFSGISRLGNGLTNFTAGTNVTSGTAAIQFASLDNDNGTVAGFGMNPTTANVIVVGGVNMGGGANAGEANFTLTGNSTGNSIGGAIVNGARVTANLIKSGNSTWSLSGDNTYTGNTTINAGTLSLSGANTGTGTIILNGGTLDLGGGTATGSLASPTLTLAGGTFAYTRTGTNTQSFTTTNINAATAGLISVTAGNTLNLGNVTRGAGGWVDFFTTGAGIVAADTSNNVGGIMPGFSFGNTWAVANGPGVAINGLSSYTLTSDAGTSAGNYTGNHIDVNNSVALDGVITTNSLRFSTAAANTLTLTGTPNVITSSGILVDSGVGANLSTITGGELTAAAITNLTVIQNNTLGGLTISSVIVDNTATGLTKSGAGLLTLTGANTYTGGTTVTAGTLQLSGAGRPGAPGSNVAVNSGALLDLNGTNQSIAFTAGSGAGIVANNFGSGTSILTLSANPLSNVIIQDSTSTPGGKVAVVVAVTSQGLSGSNNYSGGTTVNGGAFLYLGFASPTGAGTGTITLTAAGTGLPGNLGSGLVVDSATYVNDITGAGYIHANSLTANNVTFTGNLTNSGLYIWRGGTVTNNTFNFAGNGTTSVLSGVIGSTTSQVNGAVATGRVIKSGTGNLTLDGVNAYTGSTTVTGGTLALGGNGSIATSASVSLGAAGTLDTSAQTTYTIPGSQPLTIALDPAGSGSSGKIAAAGLDITNAVVTLSPVATLDDPVYVLATYTGTLTGSAFAAPLPTVPSGYTLKYAYEGNKIALVASNYATWANDPAKGNIPGEPATGDFDFDGITNIVEYALGQNPRVSSQPAGVLAGNTITYTKGADAIANGDVSWVIETSQTLDAGSWTAAVTQPPANPALTIAYTFTPSTPVKNFARLKVTQLP